MIVKVKQQVHARSLAISKADAASIIKSHDSNKVFVLFDIYNWLHQCVKNDLACF